MAKNKNPGAGNARARDEKECDPSVVHQGDGAVNRPPIPFYLCAVRYGRETRTVSFYCPYCHGWHHHGWPYDRPGEYSAQPGPRGAHCTTPKGRAAHPHGYKLIARVEGFA